ncbi:OsmC family protein [Microbacterium lushaniae]|uniref:OsmC family peroxiredoxin n=1 Tax=Microbacterium lushaniae TaxID=2614639 RepID=A0A5J6L0C9_9MICO|nr:OsmC family protein [Microbacterium lushaniae]QEW01927.1 OsmC family peroxiredoxin [Microbacterium lushaniae]
MTDHHYATTLMWTGDTGSGYAGYGRAHDVEFAGDILTLSADAAFRGDASLPNPEQLLLAAASSCQLLSFLAVAARAGVAVLAYRDDATAVMPAVPAPMRITRIHLAPHIQVRDADAAAVCRLVHDAHEGCFVANSLTADVVVAPVVEVVS